MRYFESLVTVALAASLLGAPPALAQAPAAAPAAPGATAAAPAPATADAERTTEAARRFARGLAFYRDGEYRLAQIEFDRAYELVPDYRVLYNIGQVSIQLAQYARARRALARYLAEGGAEVSEERAAAVQADLEMLAQRTAFVTVEVSVAGAEILVDDEPVGVAPLPEPLLVDAGRHAVAARHGQSTSAAQYVTVAGGDSITVQIELVRPVPAEPVTVPPPVAPVAVAAAPSAAPEAARAPFPRWWLGWPAPGVVAAGAGVPFALGDAAARLHQEQEEEPTPRDEFDASYRRAVGLLDTSAVLAAGAAVAGGVSFYVTVRHARGRPPRAGGIAPSAAVARAPRATVAVGPAGIALQGSF